MTKRLESKYKINRRLGVNLWGRPKSPINLRNYAPGEQGQKRKGKPSPFGLQLREKQKLKGYYGDIREKQFYQIYLEAVRRRGDTSEKLIELLERRLATVVYRLKWVPTMFAARQFVNHGHVWVNGKPVNIPSYRVQDGDEVQVRPKSREMLTILESSKSPERDVPGYLELDDKALKAKFARGPGLGDVPYPVLIEPNMVVEFYSR